MIVSARAKPIKVSVLGAALEPWYSRRGSCSMESL